MQEQFIKLEDDSNDKKYFTIVPNYILNHSTSTTQALYLQLKRLAGDNGIAYPSSRYLRERLKISQPTLRKEFIYLLEKKWIKYNGEKLVKTDGGDQKIKSYKIVDLWDLNNNYYQRGEKIDIPIERGERIAPQGVKQRGERIGNKEEPSEEELSIKKNTIVGKANEEYNFQNKLNELLKTTRRDMQIIGLYWQYKGFQFQNYKQWQSAVRRELKPVQNLIGYSNEEIISVMDWICEKTDFKWTLETIHKYIDEDLSLIKINKKKYV